MSNTRAASGARPDRRAPLAALAAILAFPAMCLARDEAPAEEGEGIVAEALFLADTLPAGSRDLNLVLAVSTTPTLQLAAPLGDRTGLTLDVGIPVSGGFQSPGASLKLLLRDAAAGATGLSASLDLYGSLTRDVDTEAGIGVGALRPIGPVTFRATALLATGVSSFTPRLQAGVSAALALSPGWRALAEVVADVRGGGTSVSAGPTVKVLLGGSASLMAGALVDLGAAARLPVLTLQLTQTM